MAATTDQGRGMADVHGVSSVQEVVKVCHKMTHSTSL